MKSQYAQNTVASHSSAAAAGHAIYGKQEISAAVPVKTPIEHTQKSSASASKLVGKSATKPLFSSIASGVSREGLTVTAEHSRGRYLGQSKTLKNYCPQRAAELVYLQLLAGLQVANVDKRTAFRDKFATSFAAVCPNEKHHWMSFYVRCQAKLGVKVLKNFEIVFFANDSANAKPVRTKPC